MNIVNNSQKGTDFGLIAHYEDVMNIDFCSITGNTVPNDATLFYNDGNIIVNNCYVKNNILSSFFKPTDISGSTEYFNNTLSHLSLNRCEAEFPIFNFFNTKLVMLHGGIANLKLTIPNLVIMKK